MTDSTPVLAAIATTALLLGGGIAIAAPFGELAGEELSPDAQAEPSSANESASTGEMTVEDSEHAYEGVQATTPPFYSSRVIEVEGTLTLAELPVELSGPQVDVEVRTSPGETYALVANLTGYGSTPEEARQNRDEMSFAWDAGEPGDRRLVGQVEHEEEDDSGGPVGVQADREEAELVLTVPENVTLALSVGTSSGDVAVDDLRASPLDLHSTSGDVAVNGTHADRVTLDTTSGDINAELAGTERVVLDATSGDLQAAVEPARSGSIEADTTSGNVDLFVPETSDRGYRARASTTSGEASIALEDGETRSSEDGSSATFETDGFEGRSIRTTVEASTTSGDAHVGPLQGGSASPAGSSGVVPASR